MALTEKLWAAEAAYTEANFLREIEEIKVMSINAYEYLAKIDPGTWSRAWFKTFPKV